MKITNQDFLDAFDRVARTADGHVIYRYLQMQLAGVLDADDPPDGALRVNHARRKFASELMGMMAKGIDDSGGREHADGRPTEQPIVFLRGQPADVARRHATVRERLAANDPELESVRVLKSE